MLYLVFFFIGASFNFYDPWSPRKRWWCGQSLDEEGQQGPSIRQVMMLLDRAASALEAWKWDTMKARRRPMEVLKHCLMKDTMTEATTIVHHCQSFRAGATVLELWSYIHIIIKMQTTYKYQILITKSPNSS